PDQSGRLVPPAAAAQQSLRLRQVPPPPAAAFPEMPPIGSVPMAPPAHPQEPAAAPPRHEPPPAISDDWPDLLKAAGIGNMGAEDAQPAPHDGVQLPPAQEG